VSELRPVEPPRTGDASRLAGWLRLARCPGLAVRHAAALAERAGGAAALADPDARALRARGFPGDAIDALTAPALSRRLDDELARTAAAGWTLLDRDDPRYPPLLLELAVPPPVLAVRGDLGALHDAAAAIVGARAATDYGQRMARHLARDLAAAGVVVVSGLARGVDAAAHRATLDAGGRTVAVMGTGLDRVYPAENRQLADAIAGRGALVTEFAPRELPLHYHFPRRNRLIAALSWAVVVVEAGRTSGSLSTARWAVEQGRAVLAVPGRVGDPGSEGPLALLRDGVPVATCGADVWSVFPASARPPLAAAGPPAAAGAGPRPPGPRLPSGYPASYDRVLGALAGPDPVHLDRIVAVAQVSTEEALAALFTLQVAGFAEAAPGGRYRRPERGDRPDGPGDSV
jgi:DNA processing protein